MDHTDCHWSFLICKYILSVTEWFCFYSSIESRLPIYSVATGWKS
jgi:hypothetical protein